MAWRGPGRDALSRRADRLRRSRPGPLPRPRAQGRAAAPTRRCARRSATRRCGSTSRPGSRASTSGPTRPRRRSSCAQRLAAEAWGARRSWFLVNGGSGGNHAICLALAHLGERVVVQRNVHSSVIDGLVLSGLRPRFVAPELDPELGIAHCLTPESLDGGARRRARRGRGDDRLARPTSARSPTSPRSPRSPTRATSRWSSTRPGARTCTSPPALPTAALECGADVVLSSTHKIVGSLTQSAILHLGDCGDRIDERILDRSVTLVESTSPNALLTASLDAARRQAAIHGEELLAETVASLRRAARADPRDPGPRRARRADRRPRRASTPTTRCGSSSTSAAPAPPATGSRG